MSGVEISMKDLRIAVVQDSPVLFDLKRTIEKVEKICIESSSQNIDLILFPEAFISAYPRGLTFGTVVGSRSDEGRETWNRFYDSSLNLESKEFKDLCQIASDTGIFIIIGIVEKVQSGSLYCSILYINRQGKLVGKHRKIKPTAAERIIWGEGDGSDLEVHRTELGNIGGLICWENYMPLARTALYEDGVEIYCAPTADNRDSWQHTLRHIALEGRCFVLGSNQFVRKSDYPRDLPGEDLGNLPEIVSRGGSVIIDPLGNILEGPLWDKRGILYASLKADQIVQSKMDFDPVGHYSRPDLFKLYRKK